MIIGKIDKRVIGKKSKMVIQKIDEVFGSLILLLRTPLDRATMFDSAIVWSCSTSSFPAVGLPLGRPLPRFSFFANTTFRHPLLASTCHSQFSPTFKGKSKSDDEVAIHVADHNRGRVASEIGSSSL